MTRLSIAPRRHDPYWDMDGAGVQRLRTKRRVVRWAVWFLLLAALVFVATHVPSFDADFVIRGEGRPLMAASLLGLLGSAAILALARIRQVSRD